MSYDYIVVRSLVELEELRSITSSDILVQGDWSVEASAILAQVFPSISWVTESKSLSAQPMTETGGRFELRITYIDNVTVVHVSGSRHVNQLQLVQSCAASLRGYAIDLQTGERVWPLRRNDT